jgi:HSP20 family protein
MANITKKTEQQPSRAQRGWGSQHPWNRMRDLFEWDPFGEMGGFWPGERGLEFNPSFEVRETRDGYVFKADLPGMSEDDLDINVTGNRLTVSGRREAEQRNEDDRYFCYECSYGSFSRSFTLPEGVNADDVKAELQNGVLTLHVAKKPEVQPRKIQIGGAQRQTVGQQIKPKA